MRVDVPADWPNRRITQSAYVLQELEHCMGRFVDFEEWRQRFSPDLSRVSALRKWERLKHTLRQIVIDGQPDALFQLVKPLDTGDQHPTWSLHFPSCGFMRDVAQGLIGPALRDCDTREESWAAVQALFDAQEAA